MGALTVLMCLVATASCGRKKEEKEKNQEQGGNQGGQGGGCRVEYYTVNQVEHQTQCSNSYRTECSTSYTTQCSTKTYTTYANQCSTQTVHEPVQQCSTSYTTQCYHARSKRGTKKENRETVFSAVKFPSSTALSQAGQEMLRPATRFLNSHREKSANRCHSRPATRSPARPATRWPSTDLSGRLGESVIKLSQHYFQQTIIK